MGRLRPHEIEAIISRRETSDSSAEPLAALVREVRRDLLEDPTAAVAARHLTAMNDAQRKDKGSRAVRTSNDWRGSVPAISQHQLAAVATAALLLLGAAVAVAVTPNNAGETAKNAVSNDNTGHGQAVSDTARNTSLQGCEKGQAIAAQASGKTIRANEPCSRGGGGGNPNGDTGGNPNGENGGNGANDTNGTPQGSGGPGGGGSGGGSGTGCGGGSGGGGRGGGRGSQWLQRRRLRWWRGGGGGGGSVVAAAAAPVVLAAAGRRLRVRQRRRLRWSGGRLGNWWTAGEPSHSVDASVAVPSAARPSLSGRADHPAMARARLERFQFLTGPQTGLTHPSNETGAPNERPDFTE